MVKDSGERKGPRIIAEEFLASLCRDIIATFGITDPDDLPIDDPTVQAVFKVHDSWIRVQTAKAEKVGTAEAYLEMSLKVTPFLVEAGFTDPAYVEEVVNDFLLQDLAQAEDLGLFDLAKRIRMKMEELSSLI